MKESSGGQKKLSLVVLTSDVSMKALDDPINGFTEDLSLSSDSDLPDRLALAQEIPRPSSREDWEDKHIQPNEFPSPAKIGFLE